MKKMLIVIVGLPGSGKTTTAAFLKSFISEKYPYLETKIVSRNRFADIRFADKIGQYRIGMASKDEENVVEDFYIDVLDSLFKDEETDVIIAEDNKNLNVFTRRALIEKASAANMVCGAINMNRELYFCQKHCSESIPPTPKAYLFECSRRYQQPLYEEDFFAIYNIDGTRRMNANAAEKFMTKMLKHASFKKGV